MKQDFIFWFTGYIVWCLLASLASGLLVFKLYKIYEFYKSIKWYKGFYKVANIPEIGSDEWYRVRYAFIETLEELKLEIPEESAVKLFTKIHYNYNHYSPEKDGHREFMEWGQRPSGSPLVKN